jgi:hypothetical protein
MISVMLVVTDRLALVRVNRIQKAQERRAFLPIAVPGVFRCTGDMK